MEIKEKSNETNSAAFELVPRQKGIFKLRSNIEKKVVVSVQQLSQNSCKLCLINQAPYVTKILRNESLSK